MADSNIKLVKTVNFGQALGSRSSYAFYSIYNTLGTVATFRSNTGLYEIGAGTGIYGAQIALGQTFSGSIVWEVTGSTGNIVFASDEIETDLKVTRHFTAGRWEIDASTKQMVFYMEDNSTELARFQLKDRNDTNSFEEIFERLRL